MYVAEAFENAARNAVHLADMRNRRALHVADGHAKTGKDRKSEIDMLWSPNLESRTMDAPNAMGKLIFK